MKKFLSTILIFLTLMSIFVTLTPIQILPVSTGLDTQKWDGPNILTTYVDGEPTRSKVYSSPQVIWDGSQYVEYIFRQVSRDEFRIQCPRVALHIKSSDVRIYNANMTKEVASKTVWEVWKSDKDKMKEIGVKSQTFSYEMYNESVRIIQSQVMNDGSTLNITYDFANFGKYSISFSAAANATYKLVWHVEIPKSSVHKTEKKDAVAFYNSTEFLLFLGWEDAKEYFNDTTIEPLGSGEKVNVVFANRKFYAGEVLLFDPIFYSEASLDGFIDRYGLSYPPSNLYAYASSTELFVGQDYAYDAPLGTWFYHQYRGYLSFDTSFIPDDSTITAATLYAKTTATDNTATDFYVNVYGGSQPIYGSSLDTGDWGRGTSYQSQWWTGNWQPNTWVSFGIATGQVNKVGRTQFELKSPREGTAPTGQEFCRFHTANSDYDPYLEVSYTQQKTLTMQAVSGEGTTSPVSPGTYTYNPNTQVTLTASSSGYWKFDYWMIDSTKYTDNPHQLIMSADYTVKAYFWFDKLSESIDLGMAWLNRMYEDIGGGKAVCRNSAGTPIRLYDQTQDKWVLVGTEHCKVVPISFNSTHMTGDFTFDINDDGDFSDLVVYADLYSVDSDTMALYMKEKQYKTSDTVKVYLDDTLVFTGNQTGQYATLQRDYGWQTVCYAGRHASRMLAHLYEDIGETNKAQKLDYLMDSAGYVRDIFDPLFDRSKTYPDNFFVLSSTWENMTANGNDPLKAYWQNLPKASSTTMSYHPYKSRLFAKVGITAENFWINFIETYTPRYDALYALHMMYKYGKNNSTAMNLAKQAIDRAAWDGWGCRRTVKIGGVTPYSYSSYPTYVTGPFLAAVSLYANYSGDNYYKTLADQVAGVVISYQWRYPTSTRDYGNVYYADEVGGFMTSYLPGHTVSWYPSWGPMVDMFFDLLEKFGFFQQQKSEKMFTDFTNSECTVLNVQALRAYKKYLLGRTPTSISEVLVAERVEEADGLIQEGSGTGTPFPFHLTLWDAKAEEIGNLRFYAGLQSGQYANAKVALKYDFKISKDWSYINFTAALREKCLIQSYSGGSATVWYWIKVWQGITLLAQNRTKLHEIIGSGLLSLSENYTEIKTQVGNIQKDVTYTIEVGFEANATVDAYIDYFDDDYSARILRIDVEGEDPPILGKFGYETIGGYYFDIGATIDGAVFTCSKNSVAQNITAALSSWVTGTRTVKVKCAIYIHSNSSLVKATAERTITLTNTVVWFTFNFTDPKPSLVANTEYVLVAWSNPGLYYAAISGSNGNTNQRHQQTLTYNGFPNPANFNHNQGNYKLSIYCTYIYYEE